MKKVFILTLILASTGTIKPMESKGPNGLCSRITGAIVAVHDAIKPAGGWIGPKLVDPRPYKQKSD